MRVDKHDGLVATLCMTVDEATFISNCVRLGLSMTPGVSGQAMGAHLLEQLDIVERPVKFFPMKKKT